MKSVGRLIYSVIVVTIVPVPTASNSPSYRSVIQLVYRRCSFFLIYLHSELYLWVSAIEVFDSEVVDDIPTIMND